MRAWHFVGKTLRDGRPVPADGVWLKHDGPLFMCRSGLHASLDPFDALMYEQGETLCLVECDGEIQHDTDKLVCSRRMIVARMDATEMLRYFARMQALSVVHLWNAPDVVLDYLMSGDESIREAVFGVVCTERATVCAAARAAACTSATEAAADSAWSAAMVAAPNYALGSARAAMTEAARKDFNSLVRECFEAFL